MTASLTSTRPVRYALALAVVLGLVGFPMATRAVDDPTSSSWRGALTAFSAPTFPATLQLQVGTKTYLVRIADTATLVRQSRVYSALDELGLGDDLQVWGTLAGTTITATQVKNWSLRRGPFFRGTIESIDPAAQTFVLNPVNPAKQNLPNQTVTTTNATTIFQGNRPGAFSDLGVGMTVKVLGERPKGQDTIAADRVLIRITMLEGQLASVDCAGGSLGVSVKSRGEQASWTVALTAATVIRDRGLDPVACASLKSGDRVGVRGLRTGTNALRALQVMDQRIDARSYLFPGSIASLDPTVLTLVLDRTSAGKAALTISLTAETVLINKRGRAILFEDLVVGHNVQVRAVTTSGTTAKAIYVLDQDRS
ncbi:MAG: hypothetical protein HYZ09_04140 [Candidatus Kerfeldbacteria bacterium]|nr:hypothetical protein [Candidatus Kerfeldbacteria bacterium]